MQPVISRLCNEIVSNWFIHGVVVPGWIEPGLCAGLMIEGRLQGACKISLSQPREGRRRIVSRGHANGVKPAFSAGDMADFVSVNDFQRRGALRVAGFFQARDHAGRDVEAARFENQRRDGEAPGDIAAGRGRGFPQAVMGRLIAIFGPQFLEARADQCEMSGLLSADSHPVTHKRRRVEAEGVNIRPEPHSHIKGEINGVELDMGDSVEEGGAARWRTEAAFWNLRRGS